MSSKYYVVKAWTWETGKLESSSTTFPTYEEAFLFIDSITFYEAKIYNSFGELIHVGINRNYVTPPTGTWISYA